MLKLTGQDAQKYINHEIKDLKATAYIIKDANETKVQKHAEQTFESGRALTKTEATQYDNNQKKAGTSSETKVVDQYNLVENNCTTKSIEAVKAGGTSLDFTKTVGVMAPPVTSTQIPIYSPAGLKNYLDDKSK
jgi:tRNA(Met) C34 N-acetyltransferase TmcA